MWYALIPSNTCSVHMWWYMFLIVLCYWYITTTISLLIWHNVYKVHFILLFADRYFVQQCNLSCIIYILLSAIYLHIKYNYYTYLQVSLTSRTVRTNWQPIGTKTFKVSHIQYNYISHRIMYLLPTWHFR